jgi:hypothetical protein
MYVRSRPAGSLDLLGNPMGSWKWLSRIAETAKRAASCGRRALQINVKKAAMLNRRYRRKYGWGDRETDIERLLQITGKLGPREFATRVGAWQCGQGLHVDGIIGPVTWGRMQAAIGGSESPPGAQVPPGRSDAATVRRKERSRRITRSHYDKQTGLVRESPAELLEQARANDPTVSLEELTAARLIASEHDSGTETEWAAIVASELNRADRKGMTLYESLTLDGRFGRQGRKTSRGNTRASTRRDSSIAQLRIARKVLSGELRGIAKGAQRFFDPRSQDRGSYRCNALEILEKWSFDYPRGTGRCFRRRAGRRPVEWVGPVPGIDPYRLMLFRPARLPLGPDHAQRFEAARDVILQGRGRE